MGRGVKMKLDDEFKFGKCKGQQVEDVIEDDPQYMRWLCENTKIDFADDVLEKLEKREQRK